MNSPIRILIVEDIHSDAVLAEREILKSIPTAVFKTVETEPDFIRALEEFQPDLIVSDYQMPTFDGLTALKILQDKTPITPFIMHTGSLNEDTAVMCMKAGATDYVIKEYIKRLGPAVKQALENKKIKIENREVQAALIESEKRFRRLAENAQDLIYRYDYQPANHFSYVSPAATAITGYSPEEHYADPQLGFKLVHPDDRHLLTDISSGKQTPLTIRWIKKDGTIIWTEQRNVQVFDSKGNLIAIEGIARDITERKLFEEQLAQEKKLLRTLIDNLPDNIYIKDTQMRKILTNKADLDIIGMTEEETIGKSDNELFPEEVARHFLDDDRQVLEQGKYVLNREEYVVNKKGQFAWLLTSKLPLFDQKGKITGLIGIGRNITERKQAEKLLKEREEKLIKKNEEYQKLNQEYLNINSELTEKIEQVKKINDELKIAKEKAEESDRLKLSFLANISHEIRTPMNGILGFLDLLGRPNLDEDQREKFISLVNRSGQRLLATINDIVEISKIESGQIEIQNSEVSITEIMNYQYDFTRLQCIEKGLDLYRKDKIIDEDTLVITDQHKLHGILTNLLSNALKFTHKGSIEFGNYIGNEMMVFYVKDSGVGISPDRINVIFDRFIQGDPGLTRQYEGSGLGLSIAKAYVEKMNGNIWVESEISKGSTFYFSIPYNPVKIQKVFNEPQTTVTKNLSDAITVLLAEDDETSYEYIEFLFRNNGINLLHTYNGEDTVNSVKENPSISVVLIDIKMPGMDGLEATRKIREFNSNIPIIAQTAHALSGDKDKALEAGCNDYITKPIKGDDLMTMICKYTNLIPCNSGQN